MPRYRITTLVKGKLFYDVEAADKEAAESAVYAFLEGDESAANWSGEDMDVESIQNVEEV